MTRAAAALLAALCWTLTPTPAEAATGCKPWVFSTDGHSVGVHCDTGPGAEYRTVAWFCGGPVPCFLAYGKWKVYGATGRSTATAVYGVVSSQVVQYR